MTELPGIIETEKAIERAEGLAASSLGGDEALVDSLAILVAIARAHLRKKRMKEQRRRDR